MAASMKHMNEASRDGNMKIHFSMRSGASLVSVKPVFSHDNKYLFVCSADVIKVYSTVSGECLRELVGHEGNVTGLILHPTNRLQILSCSEDKFVIVWDYSDGIQLKKYLVGKPTFGIFNCGTKNTVFLLIRKMGQSKGSNCELIEKSLTKKVNQKDIMANCPNDIQKIAIGPKGQFFVTAVDTNLKVKDLSQKKTVTVTHSVESSQAFTCVSSHPNGNCVATGCLDGTIYLWFEFLSVNAVKSKLHWHSLPVRDLSYTPEGSYLLSGGHECVLVKWHQQTEYRDFLPRLGAPVNHIVCSGDNQLYALCLEDNVIQVVTSSFSVQQVFQGLTRSNDSTIPTGLKCDPRTQALVLNGKPGHIQFYSVHDDKQLFNLDIVCQNFISSDSLDKPLRHTEISHTQFDETGQWLFTVEYWNDGHMSPEIRLKFWVFDEENQSYTLNTTAEQAHSSKIGSLECRPSSSDGQGTCNMIVTTSEDGKFKIWTLTDDSDIYRENIKWICQSVGFYRDIPAGDSAFSEDGTLLAVVFDSCITLWDPDTNLLRETLMSSVHQSKINHILFGNHNCSQYLVSCTDNTLTVWNLINCSISWSADYSVVSITKDPSTDYIAAFSTHRQLHVFKPSHPTPVFINQDVCSQSVISSVFIPHSNSHLYDGTQLSWQTQSELYFMDNTQQLFSVSLQGSEKHTKSKDDVITIEENVAQSALSWIMKGHTNQSGLRVDQKAVTSLQPHQQYLKEILSSPAHVQPSVSMLCQPFVKSLLVPLPSTHVNEEEEEEEEELTQIDGSQTASIDSGLDSDSDMDTTENQSTEIQTELDWKSKTQIQSKKNEDNGKNDGRSLSKKNELLGQKDIDLKSSVFVKSLEWYSEGNEVS